MRLGVAVFSIDNLFFSCLLWYVMSGENRQDMPICIISDIRIKFCDRFVTVRSTPHQVRGRLRRAGSYSRLSFPILVKLDQAVCVFFNFSRYFVRLGERKPRILTSVMRLDCRLQRLHFISIKVGEPQE